jgi:hypothetical protein
VDDFDDDQAGEIRAVSAGVLEDGTIAVMLSVPGHDELAEMAFAGDLHTLFMAFGAPKPIDLEGTKGNDLYCQEIVTRAWPGGTPSCGGDGRHRSTGAGGSLRGKRRCGRMSDDWVLAMHAAIERDARNAPVAVARRAVFELAAVIADLSDSEAVAILTLIDDEIMAPIAAREPAR